ncbi:uncharacterized protein SCHCODRAFT_02587820 [Schizophyllum commune H4-8]|nr:uncharacterized protein SCHCODRAFT_02587820 [Schizophyllum commune H4-8]KAI5888570.1 hypothetical protein SCHCODRAFT_02587820 [Schizophyllum commune H4-8]
MDPGTILAVIDMAGKVTVALCKYASSAKGADKARLALWRELSSISGTLMNVKYYFESLADGFAPETQKRMNALRLWEEGGPIKECMKLLDNFLRELDVDMKKQGLKRKLLWPFKEETIEEFLKQLERHKAHLMLAFSINTSEQLTDIAQISFMIAEEQARVRLEKEIADTQRASQEESRRRDSLRDEIIRWLQPVDNGSKHAISLQKRQEGTCKWIFTHDTYRQWSTRESGMLWLSGIPGSGKSVMASSLIDALRQKRYPALVYHYCDFGDPSSTSVVSILRSLFVQLLRNAPPAWFDELNSIANQVKSGEPPSSILEVYGYVQRAVPLYPEQLFIIDALDECQEPAELIRFLVRLSELGGVHVFVTSRNERAIYELLQDTPTISLTDEKDLVNADIREHVVRSLATTPGLSRLPSNIKKEIEVALLSKADCMFRWVECQLDFLATCRTRQAVNHALNNLPKTLYETYERILQAIDRQGTDMARIAQHTLRWLVGAQRPIRLNEIQEAVMIEVGEDSLNEDLGVFDPMDVLHTCSSLVSYDNAKGVVNLSHFTVQEYLLVPSLATSTLSHFSVQLVDLHRDLALQCLTYISFDNFAGGACYDKPSYMARLRNHPLFDYVAHHWTDHVAQVRAYDAEVYASIDDLLFSEKKRPHCLAFRQNEQGAESQFTSKRAFEIYDKAWWTHPSYANQKMKDRQAPGSFLLPAPSWWYAIKTRQTWLAERMFHDHPSLITSEYPYIGFPLMATARHGLPEVARILLDMGADVNAACDCNKEVPRTALYSAVEHMTRDPGHLATFRLLLERGAEVNRRYGEVRDTVLQCAAALGDRIEAMRLLLERGADREASNAYGETSLHIAVRSDSLDTVEFLLGVGCNVNARTYSGKDALQMALEMRSPKVVQCLLERGPDLSQLHFAAEDLDWARGQPWSPTIVSGLMRSKPMSDAGLQEVYDTLRRGGVPEELVLDILDLAELWSCSSASRAQKVAVDSRTQSYVYAELEVPDAPLRSLTFVTVSHDQGWSDYEDDHGTYRRSSTWFEAGVKGSDARRLIQQNIHASSDRRLHTNTWSFDTPDPELQEWLRGMQGGRFLQLIARAQYQGWVNHVYSAEIRVFSRFSPERRLSSTERSRKWRQDPLNRAWENANRVMQRRAETKGLKWKCPKRREVKYSTCVVTRHRTRQIPKATKPTQDEDALERCRHLCPPFLQDLLTELSLTGESTFVHLGSGMGGAVIQAAFQTGCQAYGIELDPHLYSTSIELSYSARLQCERTQQEIGPTTFENACVYSANLLPSLVSSADLVLVDNDAFDATLVDHLFRWIVLIMKHGSVIAASKPLTGGPETPSVLYTAEHNEDIYVYANLGIRVHVLKRTRAESLTTSWSTGGSYFLHRVCKD